MTKKTQKGDRKELKDLNLIDNFLFYEMVESEAGEWFCRYLLETVFQRPIGEIQMLPQKNIQGSDTRKRGVRLDIQIEEGQKRMYDLEPDKYTTRKKMPYRSRCCRRHPRRVRLHLQVRLRWSVRASRDAPRHASHLPDCAG